MQEVEMREKVGPVLPSPLLTAADVETVVNGGRLDHDVDVSI